jgi:hypothetical protein
VICVMNGHIRWFLFNFRSIVKHTYDLICATWGMLLDFFYNYFIILFVKRIGVF